MTHAPAGDEGRSAAPSADAWAPLVRNANARLRDLDPTLPPDGMVQVDLAQLERAYESACQLCDGEAFLQAAPLALRCFATRPAEPRFAVLAASCLQRLAIFREASLLYLHALAVGAAAPITTYRIGECLLGLGRNVEARKAFDVTVELTAHEPAEQALHQLAVAAIQQIDR